uniref:PC-esterase domain containing 1A n=1 Tax=Podarcis muralis TaxID=64176 RepID=A0A670IW08_PODMU
MLLNFNCLKPQEGRGILCSDPAQGVPTGRCVYKDLVQLLQSDSLLTASQLKSKGELRFEDDHLVEGGVLGSLHNGTRYRRGAPVSYRPPPCPLLLLTRVYSEYVESILEDFQAGPKPDVLVLNSCVWDVSRYGPSSMKAYRKNLETVFNRLDAVLPASCLVIWNMTMPLGPRVTGGFLIPELQHLSKTLRNDIIEGNFYGATLAGFHLFDVLDLHFHFRFDLRNRVKDGVHWNNVVHRRITNLLLTHVADAWRVVVPSRRRSPDGEWAGSQLASGSFHCREGRLARSPGCNLQFAFLSAESIDLMCRDLSYSNGFKRVLGASLCERSKQKVHDIRVIPSEKLSTAGFNCSIISSVKVMLTIIISAKQQQTSGYVKHIQ